MSTKDKIVKFKSVDEVLEFAIMKEQQALEFYTNWAPLARNDAMKQVFKDFAHEEEKHKKILEDIKAGGSFKDKGKEEKEVTDLRLTDYFLSPEPSTGMNYQDALLLAIKREKDAYGMYKDLAGAGIDPGLTEVFEDLARMESKHKLKLESIYDDAFMRED